MEPQRPLDRDEGAGESGADRASQEGLLWLSGWRRDREAGARLLWTLGKARVGSPSGVQRNQPHFRTLPSRTVRINPAVVNH